MVDSYLPVLVFLALGTILGVAFTTLNRVVGPQKPSPVKSDPTSAACRPTCGAAFASGSAST